MMYAFLSAQPKIMNALQGSVETHLSALQAVHAELEQRFSELQQQHQSDAAAATSRQATLQSELQGLTEVHVSVLNQLSEATAEVNELGDVAQDYSQLSAQFANLQAAHVNLHGSKEVLDAEHALLLTKADSLTRTVADSEATSAELNFKLTALQCESEALRQHLAESGTANAELNSNLTALQCESGSLSHSLADSEAANAELSSKLTALQSQADGNIADLEAELATVSEQCSAAQQASKQLHEEVSKARAAAQELADAKEVCEVNTCAFLLHTSSVCVQQCFVFEQWTPHQYSLQHQPCSHAVLLSVNLKG